MGLLKLGGVIAVLEQAGRPIEVLGTLENTCREEGVHEGAAGTVALPHLFVRRCASPMTGRVVFPIRVNGVFQQGVHGAV
ncbi:hypothetical protein GCM10017781_45770 [Deinococcus metalli]|uniref:Uncharacterized protein n=1 Tax=Deinococcus metalli TaxID=1141878 RepID=A0ABQ3JXB3_9DEIO|nr:hypothetical protein GCM10017781_45770 [Deinococcus metalli]